ncbi:DUF547 domain-containing protein [Phenylobacterium sp.]|uniref:DUF547 domain-containing protein n=1 Tax=Phenylobacterium sp. TaxID=1871053 RepID=UPI002731F85B|nr:DUF547 domain-containing protein [Phenylobacterium sp.]MDP2214107.1 DUF547 domain-containing protein [Phenylobacterium sp.]
MNPAQPDMVRRSLLGLGLAALAVGGRPAAALGAPVGDAAFDRLLARYVRTGKDGINRVDYAVWRAAPADRETLGGYIRTLQAVWPKILSEKQRMAFWINLYNAETLRVVLDAYPVRSIRAIRPTLVSVGPWKAKTLTVDGERLSLDDIENRILRGGFGDPRIHYALNCASLGCPDLMARTWRGDTLAVDLDRAARAYVNHPRGVRITPRGLVLSSIYRWYRTDFGGGDAAILAHLATFADPSLRAVLDSRPGIVGYDYDWSLNDV